MVLLIKLDMRLCWAGELDEGAGLRKVERERVGQAGFYISESLRGSPDVSI